jgi:hypothetical protein
VLTVTRNRVPRRNPVEGTRERNLPSMDAASSPLMELTVTEARTRLVFEGVDTKLKSLARQCLRDHPLYRTEAQVLRGLSAEYEGQFWDHFPETLALLGNTSRVVARGLHATFVPVHEGTLVTLWDRFLGRVSLQRGLVCSDKEGGQSSEQGNAVLAILVQVCLDTVLDLYYPGLETTLLHHPSPRTVSDNRIVFGCEHSGGESTDEIHHVDAQSADRKEKPVKTPLRHRRHRRPTGFTESMNTFRVPVSSRVVTEI